MSDRPDPSRNVVDYGTPSPREGKPWWSWRTVVYAYFAAGLLITLVDILASLRWRP